MKEGGIYRSECHYGSFKRFVELPDGVDSDRVLADYANGVLTVKIGKTKGAEMKRVPIQVK